MKITDYDFLPTDKPKGVKMLLDFGEYNLSVVSHEFSYGGENGLYEIGVFKGNDMVELPGITAEGDTVKGYLEENDLNGVLKKMYLITGKIPEQVT
jgi:hypothetical protein